MFFLCFRYMSYQSFMLLATNSLLLLKKCPKVRFKYLHHLKSQRGFYCCNTSNSFSIYCLIQFFNFCYLSGILDRWEEHGFTTVNGKIKFNKGIMTIEKDGFYNVYSQIFFHADEPGIDPHLVHYVYLFRKHRSRKEVTKYIILRGFITRPEHVRAGQGFYTTNAAGVFRLMPGDQLAVGVDPVHMGLISYADSATFFGAYMI